MFEGEGPVGICLLACEACHVEVAGAKHGGVAVAHIELEVCEVGACFEGVGGEGVAEDICLPCRA